MKNYCITKGPTCLAQYPLALHALSYGGRAPCLFYARVRITMNTARETLRPLCRLNHQALFALTGTMLQMRRKAPPPPLPLRSRCAPGHRIYRRLICFRRAFSGLIKLIHRRRHWSDTSSLCWATCSLKWLGLNLAFGILLLCAWLVVCAGLKKSSLVYLILFTVRAEEKFTMHTQVVMELNWISHFLRLISSSFNGQGFVWFYMGVNLVCLVLALEFLLLYTRVSNDYIIGKSLQFKMSWYSGKK